MAKLLRRLTTELSPSRGVGPLKVQIPMQFVRAWPRVLMALVRYKPGAVTESRTEISRSLSLIDAAKLQLLRSFAMGSLRDKETVRPFGLLCVIASELHRDISHKGLGIMDVYWSKYINLVSTVLLIGVKYLLAYWTLKAGEFDNNPNIPIKNKLDVLEKHITRVSSLLDGQNEVLKKMHDVTVHRGPGQFWLEPDRERLIIQKSQAKIDRKLLCCLEIRESLVDKLNQVLLSTVDLRSSADRIAE